MKVFLLEILWGFNEVMRLDHFTESRWPKIDYNLTEKNWQQRTLMLELDYIFGLIHHVNV